MSFHKAATGKSSVNITFSKTQLFKIIESRGFLSRLLASLLKVGLPLITNILQPLDESVLIPFGLTATVLTADAEIHKKIPAFGKKTLVILNEEMKDIKKKPFEDSGLIVKDVTQTIENETK